MDSDNMLVVSVPLDAQCSKLVERSVSPTGLLQGLLPAEMFHYSMKFERGHGGKGACMRFLVQCYLFGGETSIIQSILRKTATSVGSDRIGIAVCKGAKGIARRVDELATMLTRVSPTCLVAVSVFISAGTRRKQVNIYRNKPSSPARLI